MRCKWQQLFLSSSLALVQAAAFGQRQAKSGWVETEATPREQTKLPTAGPPGSVMLQGGVEHSVDMPALPENLRVGEIFDESLLKTEPNLTVWYQIPGWLAGEWHREQESIVSTYYYDSHQQQSEPQTITARQTAQFGMQSDRLGGIWHCRIAAGGVADCGSYYSVALLRLQEPVEVAENKVVIRDVFTELHVAKEGNVILLSIQAESLTTYHPWRDGRLKTTMSVKFFEEDGSPKSIQKNIAYDERTAAFAPLNSYKGNDLHSAFKQFLVSRGTADLVP